MATATFNVIVRDYPGGNASGTTQKTATIPEAPGTFGPTDGAPSVRANAGPRPVSAPPSYTQITTADNANFQTILDTGGAGATFWIRAGTYNRGSSLTPLANQTLVFESGAILDGGGTNMVCLQLSNVAGVTIRGGKVQNVGSTGDSGWGIVTAGAGNLIEDFEATTCRQYGVAIQGGTGTTMQYCYLHGNGRAGYAVNGGGGAGVNDASILHCEIAANNTRLLNPGGEAGSGKTIDARQGGLNNMRFAYNWVHDEYGFGPWWDYCLPPTIGPLIEENVVERCLRAGIFYEASGGGAIIRRNYVLDCGDGDATYPATQLNSWGILVSCSDGSQGAPGGISITRNIVENTVGGDTRLIGLVVHDVHPFDTKNVSVTLNQCWMRAAGAGVGGYDEQATKTLWTEATNDFDQNEYHVASLDDVDWRWDSGSGSGAAKTWAQWQAFGFDAAGSRVVI